MLQWLVHAVSMINLVQPKVQVCAQKHMFYTQKSLSIGHQARPALSLLVEKQSRLSPVQGSAVTSESQKTAHLPLGHCQDWVVGDHLNKNTDSILARTHHRLIWTEKCQLRHQMSKNLEITSEEEPVCKQKIFTLQNLVRLTSLRLNVHHSICKW